MKTSITYLIHFASKYKHAGHYIGSADDLEQRLADHRSNQGARLLQVINAAGIAWEVARTWPGGRKFERQLKNRKEAKRLCPTCAGAAAYKRATKLK